MERIKMRGIITVGTKLGDGVSIAGTSCVFIRGVESYVDDRVYNILEEKSELFFDGNTLNSVTAIPMRNRNFRLVEVPDNEEHDFFTSELLFELQGDQVTLKYHTSNKVEMDSEVYNEMFNDLIKSTVYNIIK